jgi:Fe2+ or Zn2+ uptake regulation protein
MPTVLRLGGLRVVIYPNDHRPAHVHVIGQGHEAVFNLNCPAGPPALRENAGFPEHQIQSIRVELRGHLATPCMAWEEIHGRP